MLPDSFQPKRVGVLCETSGLVRDAFLRRGHAAVSCDILPTEVPGPHLQGDARDFDWTGFDLLIAHPPCTHLAVSGARWFPGKRREQAEAIAFVRWILELGAPQIALENPVSVISSHIRPPDQTIQPWQFGHGEVKRTCLWLKNLPNLRPTNCVPGRAERIWRLGPSPTRSRERSRTFLGIAEAMGGQWGARYPYQLDLGAGL